MKTKRQLFQFRNVLAGFMIVGILITSFGTTNIVPVHAQAASVEEKQGMNSDLVIAKQRGAAGSSPVQAKQTARPTNRIIIKYRSTTSVFQTPQRATQMERVSGAAGIALKYVRGMSGNANVLELPERLPLEQVQAISERLMTLPEVEYAEPDRIMTRALIPNDPQYPSQWHYSGAWGINAPAAWDITIGSSNIVMAVIDTGITNHADLAGRTVPGYDFIADVWTANDGNGRDADPSDPGDWAAAGDCYSGSSAEDSSWHGTHVAGTMGANGNNGIGVAGINWNSMILPVRVLGKCGGYDSDITDGMVWAAGLPVAGVPANAHPAKVINISLGGYGPSCGTTYQNAINSIIGAGTVIVVAAGNENDNASYYAPGNCNGVITVAAIAGDGYRASYSNHGSVVEITAPGGDYPYDTMVLSTLNAGTTIPAGDTYGAYQGTSMAAPHVSGIVSLMFSLNPSLTPAQVLQILQNTARPFRSGAGCSTAECGAGVADAGAALNAIPPVITGFSPASGTVGASVTISGVNFSRVSAVRFNGTSASFSIASATSITATVPAGATTGPITVTNPGGTAASSSNFAVIAPPDSFGKSSPANGASGQATNLSLTWEIGNGATSYEYCYDTTNDNACSAWTGNGTSTDKTLSGLLPATTYYWHVRAVNTDGTTYSNSSEAAFWSFTTVVEPPGEFSKSVPVNGATNQSTHPTLSWDASTGATSYEYCYDTTNDNACSIWIDNGTATSKSLSGLSPTTTYYWHVRAINTEYTTYANGGSAAFWSFTTTVNPPEVFNKSVPANGATNQSMTPTLNWEASANTGAYEYCYDTTNDNACSNWTDNGTSTNILLNNLASGTTYYWHVRAVNPGGMTYSNDSATAFWHFTTRDVIPPVIQSILRASTDHTSAANVNFTAHFSEPVMGIGTGDFTLHATGTITGAMVENVEGSGDTYTVTVNTGSGNGTLRLDVPVAAMITDLAGNSLAGLPFTGGETYTVQKAPGAGIYDDRDTTWMYTGTWLTYDGAGPYNNTTHYSNTIGNEARFTFLGGKFSLTYVKASSRGSIDVYVDGNKIGTINAKATGTTWQQTWTSPTLTADIHTVRFVHAAGSYIDIDAIRIFEAAPVVGPGTYDDTYPGWTFSSGWTAYTGTGPYNSTNHYTNVLGSDAQLTFNGTKFKLTYVKAGNRGLIVIYVDGTKVGTLNAKGTGTAWQQTWTSSAFPLGVHTVRFVHAGSSGTYIDVDAIQILGPSDTVAPAAIGDLTAAAGTATGSVDLAWTTPGDDNTTGTATSYLVRYSTSEITSDTWNGATPVNTGIPTPAAAGNLQTMTVSGLGPGVTYFFAVRAQDEESNLGGLSNSPSAVAQSPTPVLAGTYDDIDANWVYSGTWINYTGSGPYNNTSHYTTAVGSTAQITFNGTRFTLIYVKASNRSLIDVYVDGTKVSTINARSTGTAWQQTWTSPPFAAGTHTVRFVHVGSSGTYIDVDAIQILGASDTAAPAAIDDLSAAGGATTGTVALTWTAPGDDGTTGTASSYLVRYSTSIISDETTWNTAAPITTGVPTPAVAGNTQTMVVSGLTPGVTYFFAVRAQDEAANLGGLSNSPGAAAQSPTPMPAGKYDDADASWIYSGTWTNYTGSGPYLNTSHYSGAVGSDAQFTFTGTQFTFTYVKASNRGSIDVYVDGLKVGTINARGTSLAWQQVWTSPTFAAGTHTVRFVHAGGGTYIDVDAITILP